MLDLLNAAGFKIELSDLRLWLNNSDEDDNNQGNLLENRCKEV